MCWEKTVIVVMNQVRVCSPYHPESVTGGSPAANERVKKVVRQTYRPNLLVFWYSFSG